MKLSLGSTTLCYERWTGPGFPIVLAHGLTDSRECWTRLVERLAPRHDVVAYDARGHGGSPPPEPSTPPDAAARDLVALVDALRLERPALLGHSMGAVTAAVAASLLGDRCRGVVLEDPPVWAAPGDGSGHAPKNDHWREWRARVVRRRALPEDAMRALLSEEAPDWHPLDREGWIRAQLAVDPIVFDTAHEMHADWYRHLAQVTCPVLLLTGEVERGGLVDAAAIGRLSACWREARVVVIRGAGHCIRRDRFETYAAAVEAFLGDC